MFFHQLHPWSPVAIKFHHVSSFPNVPHILPCLSIRILQLSTVCLHYHLCHNVSFFLHVHTFHTFSFSSFSARLVKSFSAQFLLFFHHVGITSVLFSSVSISLHGLSSWKRGTLEMASLVVLKEFRTFETRRSPTPPPTRTLLF